MEGYDAWLEKAKEDLLWTKSSLEGKVYYGACFSAQQAAEKALKAFLIYHKKGLRKVHAILALLEDCIEIDNSFEDLREGILVLVPYYITTRYPIFEELSAFSKEQAEQAFKVAQEIVGFVERKLTR